MSERPVHERLEELYAADALGGLDDDGRKELREILMWHDAHCATCERLRADYSEVAASLALSLEPVPLASGAEDRLMTATRTVAQGQSRRARRAPPVTHLDDAREEREERRRHPMRIVVAALASAACLLGAVVLGYSLHATPSPAQQIATAFAAQPGTESKTMQDGGHKVVVYYRPGQDAALLVGTGLDDPPAGHVYELWYLPEGQTDMAPGGIFIPDDGEVVAPATVATPFTTLAVSVEPGYQTAPTGTVVLSTPASS